MRRVHERLAFAAWSLGRRAARAYGGPVANPEVKVGTAEHAWDSAAAADDHDQNNLAFRAYKPIVGAVTQVTLGADGSIVTPLA